MRQLNVIVFIIVLAVVTILAVTGYPFAPLYPASGGFIAVFRMAAGLLLIIKILRSYKALSLIFGYETVSRHHWPEWLFHAMLVFSGFIVAGLFSDIAACLLFLTYMYGFRFSKYFSIENILFQNTLFFLPFIGAGRYFSGDALLGIKPLLQSEYMYNGLFLANGLIMFSAGYEKFKSSLWMSGKASLFFSMPHLLKRSFRGLLKMKPLLTLASYLVMATELLLLFSGLNQYVLIADLLLLTLFAITLVIVVDLSFIGQITLLNMGLFLVVAAQFDLLPVIFQASFNMATIGLSVLLLLTLVTVLFAGFSRKYNIVFAARFLNGIVCPIAVFTERHVCGFYTYNLLDKQTGRQLPGAFDGEGCFGPYQLFRSRYFQGAMYPLTDYCLAANKYGETGTENTKFKQVVDLCYAALRAGHKKTGEVVLRVKKFDYDDNLESYIRQEWQTIASVEFNNNTYHFTYVQPPPVLAKSMRVV